MYSFSLSSVPFPVQRVGRKVKQRHPHAIWIDHVSRPLRPMAALPTTNHLSSNSIKFHGGLVPATDGAYKTVSNKQQPAGPEYMPSTMITSVRDLARTRGMAQNHETRDRDNEASRG
jgi:hypothetical protein